MYLPIVHWISGTCLIRLFEQIAEIPGTTTKQVIDHSQAIKRYRIY